MSVGDPAAKRQLPFGSLLNVRHWISCGIDDTYQKSLFEQSSYSYTYSMSGVTFKAAKKYCYLKQANVYFSNWLNSIATATTI